MHPCHFCGQPAAIHYTSLIAQKKVERHLCDGCARAKGVVGESAPPAAAPLDLQALVQLVVGQNAADAGALKCEACGLKYQQFRADGRLGCPHDYDAFAAALAPLLDRIHRGTAHRGKVPRRAGGGSAAADLRRELADAVTAERYEDAARLRDLIRQKEGADGPG